MALLLAAFPTAFSLSESVWPDSTYYENVHWGGDDPVLSLPQPWSSLPPPRGNLCLGSTDDHLFQKHLLAPLALTLPSIADLADFSTCHIFAFVLYARAGSDTFTFSATQAAVEAETGPPEGMTLFSFLTSPVAAGSSKIPLLLINYKSQIGPFNDFHSPLLMNYIQGSCNAICNAVA